MSHTLEQVYQDIGEHIIQSIDDNWTSAWITIEIIEENAFSLNGYYCLPSGETKRFHVHPLMSHFFMEIRKRIKKENKEAWTQAKFILQPEGDFELHFDYEDRG